MPGKVGAFKKYRESQRVWLSIGECLVCRRRCLASSTCTMSEYFWSSRPEVYVCPLPLPLDSMTCHSLRLRPDVSSSYPSSLLLAARELAILQKGVCVAPDLSGVLSPRIVVVQMPNDVGHVAQSDWSKEEESFDKRHGLRRRQIGLSRELMQSCIQFTIETRISPQWNRVGSLFVSGRDFLFERVKDAVEARLRLDGNQQVVLLVKAGRVSFRGVNIHDFLVPEKMKEEFDMDRIDVVPKDYIVMDQVRVLPNLTLGRVHSLSRQSLGCPDLATWKAMRRYWKNMYGYRLGDKETPNPEMFYVNVTFDSSPTTIFSYPRYCVLVTEPVPMPGNQAKRITKQFIVDINDKMRNICGQPLQFAPKVHTPLQVTNFMDSLRYREGRTPANTNCGTVTVASKSVSPVLSRGSLHVQNNDSQKRKKLGAGKCEENKTRTIIIDKVYNTFPSNEAKKSSESTKGADEVPLSLVPCKSDDKGNGTPQKGDFKQKVADRGLQKQTKNESPAEMFQLLSEKSRTEEAYGDTNEGSSESFNESVTSKGKKSAESRGARKKQRLSQTSLKSLYRSAEVSISRRSLEKATNDPAFSLLPLHPIVIRSQSPTSMDPEDRNSTSGWKKTGKMAKVTSGPSFRNENITKRVLKVTQRRDSALVLIEHSDYEQKQGQGQLRMEEDTMGRITDSTDMPVCFYEHLQQSSSLNAKMPKRTPTGHGTKDVSLPLEPIRSGSQSLRWSGDASAFQKVG